MKSIFIILLAGLAMGCGLTAYCFGLFPAGRQRTEKKSGEADAPAKKRKK